MFVKKEQVQMVLESLEMGLHARDACARAGVGHTWFYDKQKKDPDFRNAVDAAIIKFKFRNAALIQRAAGRSWQAAAWLLERKWPDEFSLRNRIELTGRAGGPIHSVTGFDMTGIDDGVLKKIVEMADAQK